MDAGADRAARPRDRSARLRRGSGAGLPAAGRPAAPLPRAAHCRASASIPASPRAARSRSTTIRCSPRSSRPPKRATLAIARLAAALRVFPILGVRTNIPFLVRVLEHPRSATARIDTGFLDREGASACVREPRGRRSPGRDPPVGVRSRRATRRSAVTQIRDGGPGIRWDGRHGAGRDGHGRPDGRSRARDGGRRATTPPARSPRRCRRRSSRIPSSPATR